MNKLLLLAAVVGVAVASPKIGGPLTATLDKQATANIMVSFVGSNTPVVSTIENQSFKTRTDRLNTLKSSLQRLAEKSQRGVVKILTDSSVQYKSFWISNQIYIKNADKALVKAIAAVDEVETVEEERIIPLATPVREGKPASKDGPGLLAEWGITMIQAEAAWAITNGTGVVVSSTDTGVRYTHEALRDSYRGDYGWLDPISRTSSPRDPDGHGTHTMGTIAGTKGIGVAPGVKWMSCIGCGGFGCPESALTECGEWTACPYKPDGSDPDCSKAPVLSSNSWGGGQGDKDYERITEAWIAGGIIPVFAQGNSGPGCGTANSPGDLRRVIGVGATTNTDAIASFSSLGPAADGRIKPEVSAPGQNVRSSVPDSDTSYDTYSGTSMACPHTAGVVALIKSVNPEFSFGEVRKILIGSVDTDLTSSNKNCGSIADTSFPNNVFGFGRINALKAVQAAKDALKP